MIVARMAQNVPSKPLKLLGWVITRGFEAVANRMGDVDGSARSRAVGTSLDDLDRVPRQFRPCRSFHVASQLPIARRSDWDRPNAGPQRDRRREGMVGSLQRRH